MLSFHWTIEIRKEWFFIASHGKRKYKKLLIRYSINSNVQKNHFQHYKNAMNQQRLCVCFFSENWKEKQAANTKKAQQQRALCERFTKDCLEIWSGIKKEKLALESIVSMENSDDFCSVFSFRFGFWFCCCCCCFCVSLIWNLLKKSINKNNQFDLVKCIL